MRPGLLARVLTAAAFVAAVSCTGDDDASREVEPSAETTTTEASPSAADHNDADVRFVQAMTLRDEEAVAMAALADGRASSPEVLALAARVELALRPEVDARRAWFEQWEPRTASSDRSTDADVGTRHTDSGFARLQATSDIDFDRAFLALMIEHYTSSIDMAEEELAKGTLDAAVALAREIIDSRRSEVVRMQGLLDERSE